MIKELKMATIVTIQESELSSYLDSLGEGKEFSNYTIYYCPYCVQNGEPNSKLKYYYYPETKFFYCYRCNSRANVVEDNVSSLSLDKTRSLLRDMAKSISVKKEEKVIERQVSLFGSIRAPDSQQVKLYLQTYRTLDYLPYMNNAYYSKRGFREGVLFPLGEDNQGDTVSSYQIRFFDKLEPRFYTCIGEKEFYYNVEDFSTLTITEGIFSALGAKALGFKSVIAMLGKDIGPNTVAKLRKYTPKEVYLLLDSDFINENFYNKIEKYFPTTKFYSVILKDNMDPDLAYRTYGKDGVLSIRPLVMKEMNDLISKLKIV